MASSCRKYTSAWTVPRKPFIVGAKLGKLLGFPGCAHAIVSLRWSIQPCTYTSRETSSLCRQVEVANMAPNASPPSLLVSQKSIVQSHARRQGVVAFDLGIKTLATGVNEQGRVYHVGGFKGSRWYNKQP